MKKVFFVLFTTIISISTIHAQGFGYSSKTDIGNGLYKVKSGKYYGIIDANDNVVVSIEYQDIVFKNGKALLTKNYVLHGLIDSLGVVKNYSGVYKVHPKYRYVSEGYIPVSYAYNWRYPDKWGYIDENEKPFKINQKIKGTLSTGKNSPTLFDDVTPFVDGCATMYLKKYGWKHIDTNGLERYKLNDKKAKALFRSSLYKGECIIVTDDGIKQYQENSNSLAVVKRVLSSSAVFIETTKDSASTKMIYKEGVLTLDSLMRVSKYEAGDDSIVFIEKPRKIIVKKVEKVEVPVDTLSLKDDLTVELVYKNLQANEKGKAYTEIKLVNTSKDKFEELSVNLECAGASREWKGSLGGNSEVLISFNIPARFSSTSIKRDILICIGYKDDSIKLEYPVTIKRYTPVRSR